MKRISTAVPSILGALLVLPALMTPAAAQVAAEAVVVAQQPKMKAKGGLPGKAAPAASMKESSGIPEGGRTEMAPTMQLAEGKSSIVRLQHPAARVAVGDARIADVILLNPKEVYMLGRSVGTTNLIVWQKTGDTVIADLTVSADTAALQAGVDKLTGAAGSVKVTAAADSIILSGVVPDVVVSEHILQMANAYVSRPRPQAGGAGGASGGQQQGGTGESGLSLKVINMMTVAAPQQVMLEVKVAEVSKTLVDQLGASIGVSHAIGNWTYTLLSNLLSGNSSLIDAFNKRNGNFLTIDAQKRDGLVKMLAEPNLMAISGQEASFLAGGKIFIPVSSTPEGGFTRVTLEEKEFGVAVRFTPTVLADGRINLKVAPEVSELNKEGVGISAGGITGTAILPSFTTRRAATTVQLFDGQSFAIGGLIKNNTTTNIKAVPGLGEIPVLGALFRSNDFQTDRTELVFVITPRLVKPLPPDFADNLPTSNVSDPARASRIFMGRMEGKPPREQQQEQQKQPGQPAGGFDLN